MSMQILVPLDGSRFSEQAVTQAFRLAQYSKGTVHLVRVLVPVPVISSELIAVTDERVLADERRAAQQYLEHQASRAPLGVLTKCVLLTGAVAGSLSDYIDRAGIGIIVMTTHGRSGVGRAMLGSVADELVRSVKVPLLLLKPQKGDHGPVVETVYTRRILIPLDGSPLSEQAIEQAVEVGWLTGARYTLMQVVPPPFLETYADTVEAQISQAEHEHTIAAALDYLEGVAQRLRAVNLRVETVVVTHDSVASGIVQEAVANDVDMIAMVTHGRSGWKRLALGSIADEVLHTAHLPLLVVRGCECCVAAA
jgi:nucleotide-binding universal stress UspA family protein